MRPDQRAVAAATPLGVVLLYFLFAGEISLGESMACAPVLLIAVLYAAALARTGAPPLRLSLRGLGALARSVLQVGPDLIRVGRALARAAVRRPDGMRGTVTEVPFRFGALDAADIGRRAVVVTAISLAPNGLALDMERDADALIVHQLAPAPLGGNPEWPV